MLLQVKMIWLIVGGTLGVSGFFIVTAVVWTNRLVTQADQEFGQTPQKTQPSGRGLAVLPSLDPAATAVSALSASDSPISPPPTLLPSPTTSPTATQTPKTGSPQATSPDPTVSQSFTPTPTPSPSATPTSTPSPSPSPTPTYDPTTPVLQNLGVRLTGTNSTGGPGDFYFGPLITKPISEYGAIVSDGQGHLKTLNEWAYFLLANTAVLATSDGVITRVEYQAESSDYEIDLRPSQFSEWTINYDHIVSLAVSLGSTVHAGDAIARAKGDPVGFFELALLRDIGGDWRNSYRYCPLFAAAASFDNQVSNLLASWETYRQDPTVYDESRFTYAPACTLERVVNN